jgi:subtilisin family serine protease
MPTPIPAASNAAVTVAGGTVDHDPWCADGEAASTGVDNAPAGASSTPSWASLLGGLRTFAATSLLVPLRDGASSTSAATRGATANPNDRQRAQDALKAGPTPPASHPRMQHLKQVQEALKKEGLPTTADGVRVHVVGDSAEHGGIVARTIAGPIGLAQGADLTLSEKMPDPATEKLGEEASMEHSLANLSVKTGGATSQELKTWAVDALEAAYTQPKAELDYLVAHAPQDGQTQIVNMSWGQSEDALVAEATKAALGNADSPLVHELNERRQFRGLPPLDMKSPAGQEALRAFVAEGIREALASPQATTRLNTARADAIAAVAKAREAGFLPIAAAGNFFEPGRTGERSATNENLVATLPGVLSVGSVTLGDPARVGDEAMGESSSTGAAIAAPGVGVPVRMDTRPDRVDVEGTSFAAPYAASVAALMVKANPNITPAQIEKILQSPAVAKDVKGTSRDGAGVIDPVAAVREAKSLLHAGPPGFHTSEHLDMGVRRAAYDALREMLPATSPAYKATVKLVTDDRFIELDKGTQKKLLAGLAAGKSDATLARDVIALVGNQAFRDLGPAARARFAETFVGLTAADRAAAMVVLKRADIAALPTAIKDAVTAAAVKVPGDKAAIDALVARANDPAFRKLPADAQAAFFRAVEHQADGVEVDGSPASKQHLLDFVDSAAFRKLDGTAQSRWMQALGSADPALRERSYARLADTLDKAARLKLDDAGKAAALSRRASALDAPDSVRNDRETLPGASTQPPVVSAARADKRSVFYSAEVRGIDPKKADVFVHTVTIDGKAIEVIYPRPKPEGFPTIDLIAKGLAGLPATERAHIEQVIVDPMFKDWMQAASAKDGRPNRIFMGGEAPDNAREMTAILSHEAAHLLAADRFSAKRELVQQWQAAMDADNHRVSDYATTSLQEDVAETVALYYQVKGTPDEAVMKRDFPNRYAAVKELLGER